MCLSEANAQHLDNERNRADVIFKLHLELVPAGRIMPVESLYKWTGTSFGSRVATLEEVPDLTVPFFSARRDARRQDGPPAIMPPGALPFHGSSSFVSVSVARRWPTTCAKRMLLNADFLDDVPTRQTRHMRCWSGGRDHCEGSYGFGSK